MIFNKESKSNYHFYPICVFISALLCVALLTACSDSEPTSYSDKYDPDAAVKYALKYAKKRNPDYPDMQNNCTNFVSQCLLAGGMTQDEPDVPKENSRITYNNDKQKWFIAAKNFEDEHPPHYAASTSFIRTDSFFDYWCDTRGYELEKITNDFPGREIFHEKVKLGDIVCLYDKDDKISHLGIVTKIEGYEVYYCGNTNDTTNSNILLLNDQVYIALGILHMSN